VKPIPFIDIHTHLSHREWDIVAVRNIYPGGAIPAFTGKDFFSVGLHPWEIKTRDENNESLVMMEDALEFDHVIFVGECGLDKLAETDFEEQLRVFEAQAFIAEEFKKPLIIHCVKAYNGIIGIYNKIHPSVPWIFHAYSGNQEISRQLIKRNIFFSFGEVLFNDNAKAIDSFRYLPLNKIYFETDEGERGIKEIYEKGAVLKDIGVEELKRSVWNNFNRIENISFNTAE
jgi:TatD DNase family protein